MFNESTILANWYTALCGTSCYMYLTVIMKTMQYPPSNTKL